MSDKKNPATLGQASTGELTYLDFDGYNTPKLSTVKVSNSKPTLLIDKTNPDVVIDSLTDILLEAGGFYDYGGLSEVVRDTVSGNLIIKRVDRNRLIILAHRLARPCVEKITGDATVRVNCQFPRDLADLFVSNVQVDRFQPLKGVISSVLVNERGDIFSGEGYDPVTQYYRDGIPDVRDLVPSHPTYDDAMEALERIRRAFGTFPYADANFIDNGNGTQIVDFQKSAKRDESSALAALLTAVLRPNFYIAPGILVSAAEVSGAGTGKGKFVHSICEVAFGYQPKAVSYGGSVQEFEKRLGSSLIESPSCCFFDNVNGATLKSDALASFLSENPSAMRLLGTNKLEQTSAPSLMCLTGDSVTLSEDLARRFIGIDFDARVEDPEMRKFESDVCADVAKARRLLLADALTIWRWGRHKDLRAKKRLGGYEHWSDWVIAPLVELGCADPLTRVAEAKQRDPMRMKLSSIFMEWWKVHGDRPVTVKNLDKSVKDLIRPDQSLQYYTRTIPSYVGTRIAGFILEQNIMPGKWSPTKYVLRKTAVAAGKAPEQDTPYDSYDPYDPMSPTRIT